MDKLRQYILEYAAHKFGLDIQSFWADDSGRFLTDIRDNEEHVDYIKRKEPKLYKIIKQDIDPVREESEFIREFIKETNWIRIVKIDSKITLDSMMHKSSVVKRVADQLTREFPDVEKIDSYDTNDKYGAHPYRLL